MTHFNPYAPTDLKKAIMKLKIKIKCIKLFNVFTDSGDKAVCSNMCIALLNTAFNKSIEEDMANNSTIGDFMGLIDIDSWSYQDYSELDDILRDLVV